MVKLCIFDMDGTLVNTLDTIAYFGNTTLQHFGIEAIPTECYKTLVGNGSRVLIERMLDFRETECDNIDEIHKWYMDAYDKDFMYLTRAYDGVADLLKELKEAGIKTAILSNKDDMTAKKVAEVLFEEGLVDLCLGAREGKALKPDPESVFEIVEGFGVARAECLYIGDTATDIETAKNAGLYSVGVLWGFRDEPELRGAGADLIVSNPAEIAEFAKNKN
ncbi:MAG: HAD family hydrolase [Ruminococcaceae bacterium]|nr:HAD family hydrolase [Oscillospiraceae bacterium]